MDGTEATDIDALAHALVNALAAIKGAAEVLQKQGVGVDGVNKQCLDIIIEQSEGMAAMLRDAVANND